MKALVIAPEPFFTPRGTPFSVYYRALLMAESGVEIDLLTYGEGQDVVIPGCRIIRIPRFRMLGPVKVGPSLLKLFLEGWLVLWTVGLLVRNRYAFVHAHEEAVFFCRFLQPLFRFKLVYDMHSSLPQQLTNFRFTTSKALIGAFRLLERRSLHAAAAVITICPDLAQYALAEGVQPERHFLIENSIFEDVRFATNSHASHEHSDYAPPLASGGPIIVYAGTLESYQGIDILIRAFAKVRETRPDVRMLIVGGSASQVEEYVGLARELSLSDACTFTGRVSKKAATAYVSSASVLVSPRRHGTNTPLKIYEQLASGKPLVATNIWAHTQVLDETVCFLVEPEPESMARGLIEALEDDAKRERIAAAAMKLYETRYSRTVYEGKIRGLLQMLR
jgi:glycosyltransferase involved in cell wall biosynthesis